MKTLKVKVGGTWKMTDAKTYHATTSFVMHSANRNPSYKYPPILQTMLGPHVKVRLALLANYTKI